GAFLPDGTAVALSLDRKRVEAAGAVRGKEAAGLRELLKGRTGAETLFARARLGKQEKDSLSQIPVLADLAAKLEEVTVQIEVTDSAGVRLAIRAADARNAAALAKVGK